MTDELTQIAPGVAVSGRVCRVLKDGDPKGDDLREAQQWVEDIRSRLVEIRGELEDIARIEAYFPHDSLCGKVAGSMTLALIALHKLVDGESSFATRAERSDELWADAAENPDAYVIEDGETWGWRPWGIYKKGGRDREVLRQLMPHDHSAQTGSGRPVNGCERCRWEARGLL